MSELDMSNISDSATTFVDPSYERYSVEVLHF